MPTDRAACSTARHYAIVPAAGQSRRMGSNKLLLEWGGRPLLEHVLAAWLASRIDQVIVVVHAQDRRAQQLCERMGVSPVVPSDPPSDMKESVQHALKFVATHFSPVDEDRWLLAPADMPALSPQLIDSVLGAGCEQRSIIVPQFAGRRGHPVSFPWRLANQVFHLQKEQGVNILLKHHPSRILEVSQPDAIGDIDTPEDYQRLCLRSPDDWTPLSGWQTTFSPSQ